MARLIYIDRRGSHTEIPLDEASPVVMVGRSKGCMLSIDDNSLSRQHVEFRYVDGHCEVADLSSTNGTFLNGERILETRRLRDRDLIQCGSRVLLRFEAVAAARRSPGGPLSVLEPFTGDLMAELRSLLHQPQAQIQPAVELLQRCSDDATREIGARYVQDHLRQLQSLQDLVRWEGPEDRRMMFDPETRTLSMPDGTPLKQMCCPLDKEWSEIGPTRDGDLTRDCTTCSKRVVNTKGLEPAQVQRLLQYDPQACLYIDVVHGNLAIRGSAESHTSERPWTRSSGVRRIRTARTRFEINLAAMLGDRPLLQPVVSSKGRIGSFMQVWQHRESGEIRVQQDPRFMEDENQWVCVLENLDYDPSLHFPEPFAAYLVPPDIEVGERVYLMDLIENHIDYMHYGMHRLEGSMATWTGEAFEIHYNEQRDMRQAFG